MTAVLIDTETTGLNEPEAVEVAHAVLGATPREPAYAAAIAVQRLRPSKRCELGALATHHILDAELADCPPSSSYRLPEGTAYVIGHNIDYDWGAIGKPDVRRICTLAFARQLWPEADSHSLGAMLYLLLPPTLARAAQTGRHSARGDAHNTLVFLFRFILPLLPGAYSWETLWRYSERARVPKVMPFGKHRGELIADLPGDYVQWCLRQGDDFGDEYLRRALTTYRVAR